MLEMTCCFASPRESRGTALVWIAVCTINSFASQCAALLKFCLAVPFVVFLYYCYVLVNTTIFTFCTVLYQSAVQLHVCIQLYHINPTIIRKPPNHSSFVAVIRNHTALWIYFWMFILGVILLAGMIATGQVERHRAEAAQAEKQRIHDENQAMTA